MQRKLNLFHLVVAVCMILSACSPGDVGQVVYFMGMPWETDGNTITVTWAAMAESFTMPDGTKLQPEEGEKFLIVRLNAALAETWIISPDTGARETIYPHRSYELWCDPIFEEDQCVLLFSTEGGNPEDFELDLWLTTGPDIRQRSILLLFEKDR